MVLLSFGERWHPVGQESFLAALRSKELPLRCYALEQLLNTDEILLAEMLTPEFLDELIIGGFKTKHDFFAERLMLLLEDIFPESDAEKPSEWLKWWKGYRPQHQVLEVVIDDDDDDDGESVASGVIQRAFDLRTAGMELVIVMDSTGSMQNTIDATVLALTDFTVLMQGISPKFRLGLVEYKDTNHESGGAMLVSKLDSNAARVRKKLSRMVADGGGDFPESVDLGLEMALGDRLGWERSANKLVVVVGDAPPHKDRIEAAVQMAIEANESPFGVDASELLEVTKEGNSAARRGVRPFIISTIGVGTTGVHRETRDSFQKIAEGGGGTYAQALVNRASSSASSEIATHILNLSFGERWHDQTEVFVDVFLQYRAAGLFK